MPWWTGLFSRARPAAEPGQEPCCSGRAQKAAEDAQQQATAAISGGACKARPVKPDPYDSSPRAGYLSWDEYFMAVAFLSSARSKDPNKQVGACIVSPENVILGIGYNGFPRGCSDTALPWAKLSRTDSVLETKYPWVCHAELNAVLNKNAASLQGARLFVTMYPCNECAKLLIQAGIQEIIYAEEKISAVPASVVVQASELEQAKRAVLRPAEAYAAAQHMFRLAGVKVRCMGT